MGRSEEAEEVVLKITYEQLNDAGYYVLNSWIEQLFDVGIGHPRMIADLEKLAPEGDVHIERHPDSGWQVATCCTREAGGWAGWIPGPGFWEAVAKALLVLKLRIEVPS